MTMNRKSLSMTGALLGVALLSSACGSGQDEVASAPRAEASAVSASEAAPSPDSGDDEIKAVKAATAKYASIEQARADGYTGANEPCVSSPDGAMGIHYVNPPLLGDAAVDPLRPEILLYAPGAGGKLELVGVEYWKADADQDLSTRDDEPTLLGQKFGAPMDGHAPKMPKHYDLHVWLFADNPAGMFAPFNASLSCPPSGK
jgi:hypothetical protein